MDSIELDRQAIENEMNNFDDFQEQENQQNEHDEKKEYLKNYPIEDYVFQIEKFALSFLEKKHEKLKIPEDDIRLNSEMLSTVIEKNFSVDVLKNSPEMLWAGHTLILASSMYKIYSELERSGELDKNKTNQ